MMMPPPPGSHGPPRSNQGFHQPSSQKDMQLNQQMQNMKLNQPMQQNPAMQQIPAMPNAMPYNPMNNTLHSTGNLPHGMPQSQSPQHLNAAPISTNVTYSSQPHATYPYPNNAPQSMPPIAGVSTTMAGQKTNINNNSVYQPQFQKDGPTMNQQNMQHQQGNSFPPQQNSVNRNPSPIQTYSNHPNQINGNFANGSANAFERPGQTAAYQQMPNAQSLPNQNSLQAPFQPPPNVQLQKIPPFNPMNAQHQSSPTMNPSAGNMYSPLNNQLPGMPPAQSSYQSSQPQLIPGSHPNLGHPAPMGSYPPNSPPHSGMPPTFPNAGNNWQNAQQPPGNFNYGAPNTGHPQQPNRLELDETPSTVHVREEDRKLRSGPYATDTKCQSPPFVTTNFVAQDRGICNPRFIRSSTYCLPNHPDVLKQTAMPFALTICPLANLNEGEPEPPLCLYREQGPLRCKRCKAYVCPFMNFMEGGRCFQCAFCKVVTEVPQDYFCFLDGIGERTDKYHRPELCLGSYEFLATKEYCRKEELPNPPAYIFMIEVSHATFHNGLVPILCENMKDVLQSLKNDEQNDTSKLRIGFVTYNSVLHFYNMKKNLTQPHIMVLSDVHNAFVPLLEGFLVTLDEAEGLVDCLMEHIPKLFVNEPATEVILGPVIQVGLEALKNANCSGKLLIFHSTLPNADAPGKLQHRDGQKLLGTDKQKTVILPQNDFYSKLAEDCVAAGCAVDLFLFPNAYVDIASISPVCRHTGGQLYKYTYFQAHTDGERFLKDLERNVLTTTAFDAVLRLRTSAGISPVFYYGNFFMSNTTDIELSTIDCYKAVTIELAYDDKLPENETVYAQAALLYTSCTGERKIRVHNLAIATSVGMPDVYKCCELDTVINFLAKQTLKHLLDQNPQSIKNNLINRGVKMLSCYRKNCATSTAAGQLILPDSLKLLPLYINCLLKSDAIGGGPEMSLDDRSFAMLAVNSMDVKSTEAYFYPTLLPLHDIDVNSTDVPKTIRCSIEKIRDDGAYLFVNGIYMFLWIGHSINPQWLHDLFGVQNPNLIEKEKTTLPELSTPLSKRINELLEKLEEDRQWSMRLTVVAEGDKLDIVFRQFLVEDKGADGTLSYVDFVCKLHREISKNL